MAMIRLIALIQVTVWHQPMARPWLKARLWLRACPQATVARPQRGRSPARELKRRLKTLQMWSRKRRKKNKKQTINSGV
ncbi:uncharacterized protein ACO6RY_15945 [Pungitius sinensis]